MTKKQEDRFITLDNGEIAKATFPIIVSASRSTDIPAFYADWFFYRLEKGYSAWINPFNGVKSYIGYADTRFIVFWSKNPRPLLPYLDYLRHKDIGCYIQYTINDYEKEGLERGVPSLDERIETFKQLVEKLGKGAVVWRFDPLILTDTISIDTLLTKIEKIGDKLAGYTEKMVFSFADIISYRKVQANLKRSNISYKDWTEDQMREFALRLVNLNSKKGWNYKLATCGESIDLDSIMHNHCIDDELIVRFGYQSDDLLHFLGAEIINETHSGNLFTEIDPVVMPDNAILLEDGRHAIITKNNRDKGQRTTCGCMKSKDVGEYNTCPHLCEYCYANTSKEMAVSNWRRHHVNPLQDTITGC